MMRDSFILKTCMQIVIVVILILCGCGYLAYLNRTAIADKLLDYTLQGITGTKTTEKQGNTDWITSLMNSGSDEIKDAMFNAVSRRGLNMATKPVNRTQGLATMADMLANGAGSGETDLNQLAQVLVDSLRGEKETSDEPNQTSVYNLNAEDAKGRTLLMNLCRVDVTPRVIKMLLQYGADVNAKDKNGRTALMYAAAFNRNPEVIELLLENGAKVGVRDVKGKAAVDYAVDEEIIEMLGN